MHHGEFQAQPSLAVPDPHQAEPGDTGFQASGWRPPDASTQPSGVRPYLVTAGRVRPRDQTLEIECQVIATRAGLIAHPALTYEPREVLAASTTPLSIAELAAHLKLHLGVVRILVDDLAAQGLVAVLRPAHGQRTDIDTMRRVIRGLRSIT
jgi:hypothetical protein